MNLAEYKKIESLNYSQYCDYLQNKYGIGLSDYMTRSWNKNRKCSRTKDGLFAHHKFEDHTAKLADPERARTHPIEWQSAKNIVYCDYLEHLFLHILICEKYKDSHFQFNGERLGVNGIIAFIVPELNDVFSGWETSQEWRKKCHQMIIHDKETYLVLIKRLKTILERVPLYPINLLLTSSNAPYGTWDINDNQVLFDEIEAL